jgi:hypothetical protein
MDKKYVIIASALIAALTIVAAGLGLFWKDLYKNDTVSYAAQAVGQDLVTLVLCVPLLLIAAYFTCKGSLRGRLIWTGTVFYFLYTYASYSFLVAYNQLFLVYVALFSLSLYSFMGSILSLDIKAVKASVADRASVRAIALFMIFIGALLGLMWLSTIVSSLVAGQRPTMLETYTTLVIQALDLGIIMPLAIIGGLLLWKKEPWGYVIASIVLIKGITLGTAILSMILFMYMSGIEVAVGQALFFVVIVLGSLYLAMAFYGKMSDGIKA